MGPSASIDTGIRGLRQDAEGEGKGTGAGAAETKKGGKRGSIATRKVFEN